MVGENCVDIKCQISLHDSFIWLSVIGVIKMYPIDSEEKCGINIQMIKPPLKSTFLLCLLFIQWGQHKTDLLTFRMSTNNKGDVRWGAFAHKCAAETEFSSVLCLSCNGGSVEITPGYVPFQEH